MCLLPHLSQRSAYAVKEPEHHSLLQRYAPQGFKHAWVSYADPDDRSVPFQGGQPLVRSLSALLDRRVPVCIFVIPPTPPSVVNLRALIDYSVASEEYASSQQRLLSRGHRLVVVDRTALQTPGTGHLAPLGPDDRKRARLLVDLALSGLDLCGRDWRYPLPTDGWEMETTDLSREALTQAPGGEVFAHFDCDWTGPVDVEFAVDNRLVECRLTINQGRILGARGMPAGFAPRIAGMSITEIGLGINRNVRRSSASWAEKAADSVHLGVGPRVAGDAAPPQVHFDVLLAADVHVKVTGSCE